MRKIGVFLSDKVHDDVEVLINIIEETVNIYKKDLERIDVASIQTDGDMRDEGIQASLVLREGKSQVSNVKIVGMETIPKV